MYIHGDFNSVHNITVQASFETKKIVLPGNKRVELAIWDTAGQERFHTMGVFYYRNSNGAILVYDVTDSNSWDRVKTWVKELHKIVGENIVLAIVGNKIDLKNRVVDAEKAKEYAASVGAVHYETSAKNNTGVSEMFSDVTRRIVEADTEQLPADEPFGRKPSKKGFVLEEHPAPREAASNDPPCCGGSNTA